MFQEYILINLNSSRQWKVFAVTRHLKYIANMIFVSCCNKYCYIFQEYILINLNSSRQWKVFAVTRHLKYVI